MYRGKIQPLIIGEIRKTSKLMYNNLDIVLKAMNLTYTC